MFKIIIYSLIGLALIIGGISAFHLWRVASKNKKEMAQYSSPVVLTKKFSKTLVVYYSLTGHTRAIAEKIKNYTNADIYEIKVDSGLKTGMWKYMTLRSQLKNKEFPTLAGKLPNFDAYDTIFVGAPVWWYSMATPMWAFLQQADFAGKKVVPFSTQGSNPGTYFEDFAATAKNAKLLQSARFNNLPPEYDAAVDNKIKTWLNNL